MRVKKPVSPKKKDSQYYSIDVNNIDSDFVESLYNATISSTKPNNEYLFSKFTGATIDSEIKLYDTTPSVRLFEYNDSTAAISIGFSSSIEMDRILKLFVEKYGHPEVVNYQDAQYVNNPIRLRWNFRDGFIGVSRMCIVYISNSFANLLDKNSNLYKTKVDALNQAADEYNRAISDSIHKVEEAKRINDSINRSNSIDQI